MAIKCKELSGSVAVSSLEDNNPKVSIGLPIYNGENFIVEAIESVLNQTFQDYELIISDNASTDKTPEICQRYARQDSRIHYYHSNINRGPAWNYNRVFELAKGKYFKWAAHDDVFEPTFIEKTLVRLEQNPTAVLSFSMVDIIYQKSGTAEPCDITLTASSPNPACRFQEMSSMEHYCHAIFGLIRTEVLAQTPLIGNYANSDRVLLGRLSLQGPFETVPESLFKLRMHDEQSTAMLRESCDKVFKWHEYAVWFDAENKDRIILPSWRLLYEYLAAIQAVSLSQTDRFSCYGVMVRWLLSNKNWARLFIDLLIAAFQVLLRLIRPFKAGGGTAAKVRGRLS